MFTYFMRGSDSGGGQALQWAHGDWGVLHYVFEQVVVVNG